MMLCVRRRKMIRKFLGARAIESTVERIYVEMYLIIHYVREI